jgi:hypothetical protein
MVTSPTASTKKGRSSDTIEGQTVGNTDIC